MLTSDEISQLPLADRVTDAEGPYAEAMEDGQITKEEMDEIRSGHSNGQRTTVRASQARADADPRQAFGVRVSN